METLIRARRPDEVAACVALLAAVHTADGYPAQWPADPTAWLAPEDLVAAWVAERGGRLVGHVALRHVAGAASAGPWAAATGRPANEIAVVARLFVAPSARGQGTGAALLAAACGEAAARGRHPALDVLAQDRAAVALYERAGWQRVASRPLILPDGREMLLYYYLAPC